MNLTRRLLASSALVCAAVIAPTTYAQNAANPPVAIAHDPAPDKANPASMTSFQLPSHGGLLNALVYVAAGAGPHPAVVLLHGFPGNERNLDLAQTLRRAGYDVLFFDYRGSWGSPGVFSFSNVIEDTQAAVAYLRDAANAQRLRSDPGNIILIGHSMGGFAARYVAAHNPAIRATVLISAADMVKGTDKLPEQAEPMVVPKIAAGLAAEGMAPLAGCTPESLAKEVFAHRAEWAPVAVAPGLTGRPLLVVTSDDGLAASNDGVTDAIRKAGGKQVTAIHIATDHSYSDSRIALATAVLGFLDGLPKK